jgi:formyl-CoA transferase
MKEQKTPMLHGVTVLDLSRVLAGPYCTMLLGDYGADVIKVERPGEGDETRAWGPPFFAGESAYYLSINRNKRSITVDMKTPQGKQLVCDLATRSDVLVENFTVGALDRLGLGRAELMTLNPRLVFCSISGYGQTGPDKDLPGFDLVAQARGGLMSTTGPVDGPPSIVGISVIDIFAGLHALSAILAALHARERSGQGSYIDMGLLDSAVNILSHQATSFLNTGSVPARRGNSHNNIVPYQTFQARDGYVNIAAGNEKLWDAFCRVLKLERLIADSLFATNALRVQHRAQLIPILQETISQRGAKELVAELSAAKIPASVVQNMQQVFADPQVLAREMVVELPHPSAGPIRVPAAPGFINDAKPPVRLPPPMLGQHTIEILKEKLGYDDAMIAGLLKARAI